MFKIEAAEGNYFCVRDEIVVEQHLPARVEDEDEYPLQRCYREVPVPELSPIVEHPDDAQMACQIRENDGKKVTILPVSGSDAHCSPPSFSPTTRIYPG